MDWAQDSQSLQFIRWTINLHFLYFIDWSQAMTAHSPYYLSHTHGKQLLQQKPIFAQNNIKAHGDIILLKPMVQACGISSHFQLMSLIGEILEVVVWRAKKYVH